MNIFITGATGFIGHAVVARALAGGHKVAGLAHTANAATALRAQGATPVSGSLEDPGSVASAARAGDATIHLGQVAGAGFPENDRLVAGALVEALHGSGKRLLYTSGAAVPGDSGSVVGDETTPRDPASTMAWRGVTEQIVLDAVAQGVHGIAIRPSMVHGPGHAGMAAFFQAGLQRAGVARYVGSGEYRWSTVHVDDIADLYVRALEGAAAGELFIAASDEVVSFKELAEAVRHSHGSRGTSASVPVEEARKAVGLLADLMIMNVVVSGAKARRTLGWAPQGTPLLVELTRGEASA